MASNQPDPDRSEAQQIFVRADEIDAGTSILSPSQHLPLSALSPSDGPAFSTTRPKAPSRPGLRREGTAPPPPPPSQPPPAPPAPADPVDSLSLPQLRQLVAQFPKAEQIAYAFQYNDAEAFETEIDEWFHYTDPDQDRDYLLASREAFEQRWKVFGQARQYSDEVSWINASVDDRRHFLSEVSSNLADDDFDLRMEGLGCLYYLLTGTWSTTAGLESTEDCTNQTALPSDHERYRNVQIRWMHENSDLIVEASLVAPLFSCLIQAAASPPTLADSPGDGDEAAESAFDESQYRELCLCLSALYILVESARVRLDSPQGTKLRHAILSLQPHFLVFLASMIARLRWDESYNIPLMYALQLFWKSILLLFGDVKTHLEKAKGILQPRVDPFSAEASHPVLTASPLEYHLFRQEITSKYPAYNPPLPLVPLELEQKSMLPPLPHHSSKFDALPGIGAQSPNGAPAGGSILHQPVHIATPAPSPPPSPIGPGGKGAKKQNYQTNQNLPFLYPPLDSSSNSIGGKGTTEFQDLMVGKKWEGSDIPASIIEAGELFASRMRMTRAMRQLWRERDMFIKYDRGWGGEVTSKDGDGAKSTDPNVPDDELDSLDDDLRGRMEAVENFFHYALPDLQSLIIVMMKVMLTNVQDIAVRNGSFQDSNQATNLNRTRSNPNMNQNQALPIPPPPPRPAEMSLEDLDNVRSREISQKAIAGAIFLLLKWFKLSHVLKFEYLTQLLLDSNYVQLTLKYFAHQNLEDLVAFKYDRDDLSFWHYCHLHSDHPPLPPTSPGGHSEASSLDEAIPPPIPRHRRSPTFPSDAASTPSLPQQSDPSATIQQQSADSQPPASAAARPSVDELGNPLGPVPSSPITTFSFRQFQTSIHLLRILQKLTRGKAHRILFLVQFKSSQILRRLLRVPDPMLRLYVLKLFKSQVPYCGRKWRQSNMRVITAIYLHCRPELRDEWLAGMHDTNVEGEVDEAVPLEWALRGLTFWWQKRTYPDVMKRKLLRNKERSMRGEAVKAHDADEKISHDYDDDDDDNYEGGQEIDDGERDFFRRELDAIGWGLAGVRFGEGGTGAGGEEVAFGEEAPGLTGSLFNGAPGSGSTTNGEHQPQQQQPQWVHADAASLEQWQNS